ncbi:MAG: YtxH domain-containing protein [Prolixibacteraceae bacterium]
MSTGKVLLALLAGASAGALAGILLAPHKGSVTRKKISRTTGNYADGVKEKVNELLDEITEKFEKVKEDVSEFADQKLHKKSESKKEVKTT